MTDPADNMRPEPGGSTSAQAADSFDWRLVLAILAGTLILTLLMLRIPIVGEDWVHGFRRGLYNNNFFPPWVIPLLQPLLALPARTGAAIIQSLAICTSTLLTYRAGRQTFADSHLPAAMGVVLVLLSAPLWLLLWLGQIEPFVLLGIASLPVGIPLLFFKPHMGPFVVLGSWRDFLLTVGLLALSLLIWGLWPLGLLTQVVTDRVLNAIAMGWLSTTPVIGVLGLLMLVFTDRDPWRLMATALFISPYSMPYHFYLLLPALGRVRGYRQMALWLTAFLALAVAGLQTVPVKILAMVFPLLVWLLLAPSLRPRDILNDPDTLIMRARHGTRQVWDRLHTHPPAQETTP